MADPKTKLKENTPGEFYVDSSCINCATCRKFAPATFSEGTSYSYVAQQPTSETEDFQAMQALVACPVHAIGMSARKVSKEALESFPQKVDGDIYINGFNAESSYGSDSYFIKSAEGNWLIDSPRFTPMLVRRFRAMGGLRYIFLTHRDDVADAEKYAKEFGAERIIHQADQSAQPNAEIIFEHDFSLGSAQIIVTPGHTAGHCVLLWANKYLFTGDHLPWSSEEMALRPFRDSCWYSWKEQIASVATLENLKAVEWVLPGHGEKTRIAPGKFPSLIQATTMWMKLQR
jgi:glyoxylase-like metal-dependent hydrolase (beta-lactamase superfamily II)/ferredoxin